MASWPISSDNPVVLEAAEQCKSRCLIGDGSLFQDGELWTTENFNRLKAHFVDHPLLGPQPFYSKLQQQLAGGGSSLIRLAGEAVWLLLLFPHERTFGAEKKRRRILDILGPNEISTTGEQMLRPEALKGVGHPGAAFLTKIPDELAYLVKVLLRLKSLSEENRIKILESEPWQFCELVSSVEGSESRGFRHMLLFLCYPNSFERIASRRHKQLIYSAFKGVLASSGTTDEFSVAPTLCALDKSILAIRGRLSEQYQTKELDFYREPLQSLWKAEADEPKSTDQSTKLSSERRYWVEKTIVKGRIDRIEGPNRIGLALWSPQRSADGRDIYANMRRVSPGDRVLHLTDNSAITGVSIAEAAVDDTFQGVANTAWGEQPSYRVPLSEFVAANPPLPREAFFGDQLTADRLRQIANSHSGLFYTAGLELNQGAYLTEVPPDLIEALNDAYKKIAGKSLPHLDKEGDKNDKKTKDIEKAAAQSYTFGDAVQELFLDQSEIEEILRVWKVKKNIILKGPPGVGKSFAARRLSYALSGYKDTSLVEFIQFHQSYSYEDFLEGYRPIQNGGFELRRGRFLNFASVRSQRNCRMFLL